MDTTLPMHDQELLLTVSDDNQSIRIRSLANGFNYDFAANELLRFQTECAGAFGG
jgi:hypothetical protein